MISLEEKDMAYIKEIFYIWSTSGNRFATSTAECYIRVIDHICKDFFIHDIKDLWIYLINNLDSILEYYKECSKDTVYTLYHDKIIDAQKNEYSNVLSYLVSNDKFKKNIFPQTEISLVNIKNKKKFSVATISLDKVIKYLETFKFVYQQLLLNPAIIQSPTSFAGWFAMQKGTFSVDKNIVRQVITATKKCGTSNLQSVFISFHYLEKNAKQKRRALKAFSEFLCG